MRKIVTTVLFSIILFPLFPSAPYTGWRQIKTDHFTIVFEEKSRESALEVAGFCEEVYEKVTDFFGSHPGNILTILHDRADIPNGSFYPAPPHLNLYVTSPSVPILGVKEGNWLKILLTHELTHYVNLTYRKGIFHSLSKVLGKSVSAAPGALMPGWAVEGIAVKLETDLTKGGRGRNPFFEMEYKSQIISGRFYDWKKAVYPSVFPPYDRIYQAGYLINDYLSRTYGDDIFVRIYSRYTAIPFLGFNHAVKKVTGDSVEEIFANMKEDLRQRYSVSQKSFGTLVSPDVTGNYYLPVLSEKGWILYRHTQDRENALVLYNPEAKTEKILAKVSLHDYASYTASRNGNRIVFASLDIRWNHPAGEEYTSDLFLLDSCGKVSRITRGKHLWQPALSPDGKKLVAVKKNGQYSFLVEVNIGTGKTRPLFSIPAANIYTPSFSPNGRSIVFTINERGKQEAAVLDETGDVRIISDTMGGEKYFPGFLTDNSVVFSADTDGSLALYRVTFSALDRTGNIDKICDDPVGAYAGTLYRNSVVYGSYSPEGFCLREKPLPTEPDQTVRTVITTHMNENYSKPYEAETNESTYTDHPELIFWLPVPFSLDPFDSSLSLVPGIVSYFLSPMGKLSVETAFSLSTSPVQPEGMFSFQFSGGPVQIQYSLLQGYGKSADKGQGIQTTVQSLDVTLPFIQRHLLGTGTLLAGSAGGIDRYSLYSPADFSFLSPSAPGFDSHCFFGYTGISAAITQSGSSKDIIPPRNFSLSGFLYYPLIPLSDTPGWNGRISISVPSFIKHHVIRAGIRIGNSVTGLDLRPALRGGLQSTIIQDTEITAGVDYLFTLGIVDIPIVSGLSLQGAAGGIHLEKEAGFGKEVFSTDSLIYTGAEIIFRIGYMTMVQNLGVGFNTRINTSDPSNFNLFNDTALYIFLGIDSFYSNRIVDKHNSGLSGIY
ncbi:MAG: hypothetical protein DRP59_09895 [Spirochaetes bacterium]|nr:MAG: hypothetical protein DRP59_09895 [Spirochaetota bacterium]